ncbi:MAG TPA: acetate--CoA ligase family protein, partial [Candidatus Binataceae bacterium]|nr:acetate--CoA ligase family protein [Candidatus Binataceae bacterium]
MGSIENLIAEAERAGRLELSELESKQILQSIGVAVAMPQSASTPEQAATVATQIGFPVAMKVLSPDITHKSDVGGVALNLKSQAEVAQAFADIRSNLAKNRSDARFEGVTVQPMAPPGVEMLAGIIRDQRFGALIVAGMGGTLVEILNDTAMRLAPFDAADARAMIAELKGVSILHGARGAPPADIDSLASLLVKLSQMAERYPEIREMDLNPVVVYREGLMVLDARVALKAQSECAGDEAAGARRQPRLENLKRGFDPQAVAVIGDKRVGGYLWLRAQAHLARKLYSVQIDPNEIPGIEAMGIANRKSLAEIPEAIDYAVVAVPRPIAPRILKDCIAKGVRCVSFFTSGFAETGEELGVTLQTELKSMAETSDIALVGPNCMGLYNPAIGLCSFPDQNVGEGGDVCFISQSGTHAINFTMQAAARGIKINKAASIGNAIILEAADFIDVMADDLSTRAIGMYVEGVREGRRFFESLKRAAKRVPVVIWKGGATDAGARATFSHTGALATPSSVWRTVVRQSGAVEVENLDAMLDAIELFARGRKVQGKRVGLVAMTGGQSVGITDAFAGGGLEVPALSTSSYEKLKKFFNIVGGSYRNPLDAGGTIALDSEQGNLGRILDILDRDPVIDAIVLEIATGLRGARWASHEDELITLLDKLQEFDRSAHKPFVVILHPAHIEIIVARAKELARARKL